MLVYLCDGTGCDKRIDVKKAGWIGVDEAVDTDDDDDLVESDDYGMHFCTPACMAAWAMDRAVNTV